MSTSGLSVTRVPPPPLVSRSQRGASPAPGSAGPRTSAAMTATTPTLRRRAQHGGRDRLVAVGQPSRGSLVEPRSVQRHEREHRAEVERARDESVVGAGEHRDEEEDARRRHDRFDERVEAERERVCEPRGDPHCDERRGEEPGLSGDRSLHDRELVPCVDEVEADRRPRQVRREPVPGRVADEQQRCRDREATGRDDERDDRAPARAGGNRRREGALRQRSSPAPGGR